MYVCRIEHDTGQHGGEGAGQAGLINPGRSRIDGPGAHLSYDTISHYLHIRKILEIGIRKRSWCVFWTIAHQSELTHNSKPEKGHLQSRAVVWFVEHSYMPYSFQALHDGEERRKKEKSKKRNKIKSFAFDFLDFEKH